MIKESKIKGFSVACSRVVDYVGVVIRGNPLVWCTTCAQAVNWLLTTYL